jgi:hypothetical protein
MTSLNALAAALAAGFENVERQTRGLTSDLHGSAPSKQMTILQISQLPLILDSNRYKNARSGSNPAGDLLPLFAFRQLVDPIPTLGPSYVPSAASTELIYGDIITGANATTGAGFAAQVIASAKKAFEDNTFANLDGTVGRWRPIYSTPEDWADMAKISRFKPLTIALPALGLAPVDGSTPTNLQPILLNTGDADSGRPIDANTQLRSVQIKYFLVELIRPWFSTTLFNTDGWYLDGQDVGFCSSGSIDGNSGALPLVPSAILFGTPAEIDADWAPNDSAFLNAATRAGKPTYLGPFRIGNTSEGTSMLQVFGWTCWLMPRSPLLALKP